MGCSCYLLSVIITFINIKGAKTAAVFRLYLQQLCGVGILLIASSAVTGDLSNLQGQLFIGHSAFGVVQTIFSVAVVTPFFFIGFDVYSSGS